MQSVLSPAEPPYRDPNPSEKPDLGLDVVQLIKWSLTRSYFQVQRAPCEINHLKGILIPDHITALSSTVRKECLDYCSNIAGEQRVAAREFETEDELETELSASQKGSSAKM